MIYKLTNIKPVIAKIVRDLGLGNAEIPYQDFIEWIAEGLQHIGSYYQFQERECQVDIDEFKGKLPCDFYKMIRLLSSQVVAKAPEINASVSSSVTAIKVKIANYEELILEEIDPDKTDAYITEITNLKAQLSKEITKLSSSTATISTVNNHLVGNKNLIGVEQQINNNKHTGLDYNINFDSITAAFREGTINIQYLAIPIDEDGFPLIPDDVSFHDALFWKVAYQLAIRGYEFKAQQLRDINYSRQKWNFYCTQARANANMPDLEGMERLKNQFIKLKPNHYEYFTNFSTLGKGEFIDLNGKK